jgi:DNA-binding CsgD family transcriptional regulator
MAKGYALSEATKEAIWALRAQGLSEREIARQLGLGQNTVSL